MSKVNLNIAYLGKTGANINLGKIDDIEITSPDNTVEVVSKTYDEATKVLTFELKAGSINDVEIISSDNSVEVVGREYNEETKVLKLDLKAAKSLTITSEDETVKVTEKNGNVDLGVKQVSVAPLDATTTVEFNTDASGNDTYKVGAFSSHTIVERIDITTTEKSPGLWFQSYKVKCDIVDQIFEFFDTNTMEKAHANQLAANNATAVYTIERSAEPQYIVYQVFSSTASMHKTKVTVKEDGKSERVFYISAISDTGDLGASSLDVTYTFISDIGWEIKGYIRSDHVMMSVLVVPAGFQGVVSTKMEYYHKFSGSWVEFRGYNSAGTLVKQGYEGKNVEVNLIPYTEAQYLSEIAGFKDADTLSGAAIAPNPGRYKVDCLFPLDGWEVGKKIPDSFPNDLMLHQLQLYVEQLQDDYAHLVRQINFTSSDGSINVNPIEGGGTDYTVNLQSFYGVLEINDDNKSTYYKSDEEIVYNVPAHIQTIVINTSKTLKISAIQGDNFNGRRLTLAGNYAPSERYTIDASNTEGRFSQYLYEYRAGSVTTGASSVSWSDNIAEAFETFIYFNGIWFSKGY